LTLTYRPTHSDATSCAHIPLILISLHQVLAPRFCRTGCTIKSPPQSCDNLARAPKTAHRAFRSHQYLFAPTRNNRNVRRPANQGPLSHPSISRPQATTFKVLVLRKASSNNQPGPNHFPKLGAWSSGTAPAGTWIMDRGEPLLQQPVAFFQAAQARAKGAFYTPGCHRGRPPRAADLPEGRA